MPRPRGRPSRIGTVLEVLDDGTRVTVGDRLVSLIRQGNYVETAAKATGIAKASVYEWLKVAATAQARVAAAREAKKKTPALTQHERACIELSDAVTKAEGESIAQDVAMTARLARGGLQHTVTTTKRDGQGQLIETIAKTEILPPDPRVLLWRLERKVPKEWGHKGRVEVTGADGGPVTVDVGEAMAGAVLDLAQRIADEQEAPPE